MRQVLHLVSPHREYYSWEGDWHSYLLSEFDLCHHFDPARQFVAPHTILVVTGRDLHPDATEAVSGGNQGSAYEHLRRFRKAGLKVGVIHVSDEWSHDPIDFYPNAAFVFRNYYRAAAQRPGKGGYFGLGWKAGFRTALVDKPIQGRTWQWSFAGMLKSTRTTMLRSAQRVPGGKHFAATGFGGQGGGIPTHEYAQMLNDTVFALCPRGNTVVDCFRVYEALEAGAIPIVEDDGGLDLAGELLWPWNFQRIEAWRRSYWRYHFKDPRRPSFWKMAYGPNFPCPRIMHWETLDVLLRRLDVAEVSARCRAWWAGYKQELRGLMTRTVRETWPLGRERRGS